MSALQHERSSARWYNTSHSSRLSQLLIAGALIASSAMLTTAPSRAEPGYPRKPVTIYVPYGAGGLADVTLRVYSQKFASRLGQQLVLENRPGAGGGVAAKAALANPPDGYSLFFCGSGMAISMSLLKTKPFDILQDFTQISTISSLDELLFATGAQAPFNSVQDVVAMARKAPGKLTFGSINPGSTQNLTAHLFKQITGIDVVIVPYKAVPDLITALIRGDVDVGVDYFAGFQPVAGDTRIKIIATTGVKRSALLPDVATIKESGYPDFVVKTWQGLAAPRGVSDDVLKLLNHAMVEAAADPEFREFLAKYGMSPGGSTVEAQNTAMAQEVKKWAEVIQKAGLAPQ
jgi:tripartite-type tricarboxylate transporter receptor subunit TctC